MKLSVKQKIITILLITISQVSYADPCPQKIKKEIQQESFDTLHTLLEDNNWFNHLTIECYYHLGNRFLSKYKKIVSKYDKLAYPNIYRYNEKNHKDANLFEVWNQPTFLNSYLDIYDSPEYAKADFVNIQCVAPEGNLPEKRRCLNKLLNSYRIETDPNIKLQYNQIYKNFILDNKFVKDSERHLWNRKWFQQ